MRRAAFPDWLDPMAPTLTHERFSGPEWIFERKFDGIRLLAYRRGRRVRLLSRNRLPQRHPAIVAALLALPVHDVILDGEVAWRGGVLRCACLALFSIQETHRVVIPSERAAGARSEGPAFPSLDSPQTAGPSRLRRSG